MTRNCESVQRSLLAANERVNYTFGMLLGEADFRQEQEHFEWKHRIGNALLHGHGTVCGLRVLSQPTGDASDVKIRITTGYGISPKGNWIWVQNDQCALLNEWVQRHRDEVGVLAAPGSHRVYVSLCYDECLVAPVPIAGRPCATGEDTQADSRVREAFQAQFSWTPPLQIAEEAYRQLSDALDQIEIVEDSSPPSDDSQILLDYVSEIGLPSSPPSSPPLDGPPTGIQIPRTAASETLQRLMVTWATIVCPRLLQATQESTQEEDCFFLAQIDFDVDGQGVVLNNSVTVNDWERPVIAADRLQQEMFTRFRISNPA